MKIVTGLFNPSDAMTAVGALTDNGFSHEDISMMSSVSEVPEFLEGEPEESAATGAAVGAVTGGAIGALSAFAVSAIPGFESYFVSGVMATTAGTVLGGYLGSLYTMRADEQTKIDIHEELDKGKILVIVQATEATAEKGHSLMEESNGAHVETHDVPKDETHDL